MSGAPPKPVQHRFIQKLQKEVNHVKDVWEYAVSTKWVTVVQQFIQDEDSATEIPPLFASDWDQENIYIGDSSWRVLASWYGVDKQYSCRRRCTSSSYVDVYGSLSGGGGGDHTGNGYVLADCKLDFLTTFCCLLKQLSSDHVKQQFITVYFWDSLDYIEFQLRCALKVHPKKDVRMWLSLSDDGADVLLENITNFKNAHMPLGIIICRNYPEVLEMLQKRQTLPSGDLYQRGGVSKCPVKEELWDVFLANQWQVTLCLEELPDTASTLSETQVTQPYLSKVHAVFHNLHLDHMFQKDSEDKNIDQKMKQVLDDSVQEFNRLIEQQRTQIEARAQELLGAAEESYEAKHKVLQTKLDVAAVQESRLSAREKELNERDHELNSKLAKFKSMLTEFLTKKEKFEKEVEKMAQQNKMTGSKVELNVGGVRFTTSISTLTKEEGSLLQTMFKGQHSIQPDADGSYFIDRDGTNFRHVLNFLRDGPASLQHLPGQDQRLLSELRVEAEYYQLHKMADILRAMMSESRTDGAFSSLPP
ncbi:hypothetical protein BaRGS_00008016 [Batillaria attramentaria]|uniref:BTB domain-containing protein n=1 Tax=Batillaria attramentaria TaxID=370345 RepID=A0ABD0LNZ7_9CAEN